MKNKDRDFTNRFRAYEAYCAEVLLRGKEKGFWEKYRDEGPDIEKYLSRDWEDIEKFLDWLFAESTEGDAVPDPRDEDEEDLEEAESLEENRDAFVDALSQMTRVGPLSLELGFFSDKMNGERYPASFRGGIASILDRSTRI